MEAVQVLIKEQFNHIIGEFEEILQKIASDVASGVIFERLTPSELLNETEHYIKGLEDLTTKKQRTHDDP